MDLLRNIHASAASAEEHVLMRRLKSKLKPAALKAHTNTRARRGFAVSPPLRLLQRSEDVKKIKQFLFNILKFTKRLRQQFTSQVLFTFA